MISRAIAAAVMVAMLMAATPALAQSAATDAAVATPGLTAADLEIIRTELRADKRKATAERLDLTDPRRQGSGRSMKNISTS